MNARVSKLFICYAMINLSQTGEAWCAYSAADHEFEVAEALAQKHANKQDVEAHYKAALNIDPNHFKTLEKYAAMLIARGHHERALELTARALKLRPDNVDMLYHQAIAAKSIGEDNTALQATDRILRLQCKNIKAIKLKVELLASSGKFKEAEATLHQGFALEPTNPKLLETAASYYALRGKYAKSVELASRYLALDPKDESMRSLRAASYFGMKNYAEALKDYELLIKSSTNNDTRRILLPRRAVAQEALGKTDEALDSLQELKKLEPKNDSAYMKKAELFEKHARFAEAIKEYTEVLKVFPDQTDALTGRGKAFYKLGNVDSALKDLSAAIRMEPRLAYEAYKVRAQIYETIGKKDLAKADLKLLDRYRNEL